MAEHTATASQHQVDNPGRSAWFDSEADKPGINEGERGETVKSRPGHISSTVELSSLGRGGGYLVPGGQGRCFSINTITSVLL